MISQNLSMSHLILMDESNGNGLMNVLQASTNQSTQLVTSQSTEDLSQSLSEYTDADESMSAPTEYLAEFLSAVMIKDYKNALKYCTLILQFEPNNATAKEFHPLILEKLKKLENPSSDSDENDNTPSKEGDAELGISHKSNIGGSGGSELSGSCSNASESEYSNTPSDSSDEKELDINSNNSNHSIPSDSSDNTTHSYSSLLLEEEEDEDDVQQLPANYINEKIGENLVLADLKDAFNGNSNYISQSCSDSESPTEPLTQKIAAILRSKCVTKSSDT